MPELTKVIDLAVKNHPDRVPLVRQRVLCSVGEVNDLEAPATQKDRWTTVQNRRAYKSPFAIRTTVPQQVHHLMTHGFVHRPSLQIHEPTDSTHVQTLIVARDIS